jgi:hypothetical protein
MPLGGAPKYGRPAVAFTQGEYAADFASHFTALDTGGMISMGVAVHGIEPASPHPTVKGRAAMCAGAEPESPQLTVKERAAVFEAFIAIKKKLLAEFEQSVHTVMCSLAEPSPVASGICTASASVTEGVAEPWHEESLMDNAGPALITAADLPVMLHSLSSAPWQASRLSGIPAMSVC